MSSISNPPGRSQISYRAADFASLRAALLRALPGEQAIGDWHPAAGDLGLQVLEWWAYLGDVLTFYNERIASESYLRTATRPDSLAGLVALLGYQPAPGVAAGGTVAAIRTAAHPAEPLVIPAGMRLTSLASPGVPAQTFEAAAAASFAGPSAVPVTLAPDDALAVSASGGPAAVLLAGPVSGIRIGEQLVLAARDFDGSSDSWSLVTVAGTTAAADPGTGVVNTLVMFADGAAWGPSPEPARPGSAVSGSVVSGSAAFGSVVRGVVGERVLPRLTSFTWRPLMPPAAPPGPAAPAPGYRLLRPTAAAPLWNNSAAATGGQVVIAPAGAGVTVQLAAAVRAIAAGDVVLCDRGAGAPAALATVASAAEVLWTVPYPGSPPPVPPFVVAAHTALTLTLATLDARAVLGIDDPAAVTLRYGMKDLGTIIGSPASSLASLPAAVTVPASYVPPDGGATAILADATGAGVLVTVSAAGAGQVTLTGAGTPPAAIDPAAPLAVPLQLLTSLVPVSRGTTVTGEVLGSGNAAVASQSFTLGKSPLTYLASGEAALAVAVSGAGWTQVPSFYGQAAGARVFVVSRSADQSVTTVTFGDGADGARLPSGSGNVIASYRYGSGAASPPAGRLTTISAPQPGLASVRNPVPVSGGSDPQPPDSVRAAAPASVFTFGRAISADDYAAVAARAPGVARVAVYWTFDGGAQRALVKVYVGDDPAAAAAAAAALAGSADPNRPVLVAAATAAALSLSATLLVAGRPAGDALADATAALGALLSPDRLGIGQRLYRSAVDAALLVPGVTAVRQLTVSAGQPMDQFLDPGEGAFFSLPPGGITLTAVTSGGDLR